MVKYPAIRAPLAATSIWVSAWDFRAGEDADGRFTGL
jgi:hypothetical protein